MKQPVGIRFALLTLAHAVLFLLSISNAAASTRTVCYELKFPDVRTNCPTSAASGERRACAGGGGTQMAAVGHVIQLWDNNGSTADFSDDTFLGEWKIAAAGSRCVTFQSSESNPDVYLRWVNVVEDIDGSRRVVGKDGNGNSAVTVSFINAIFNDCSGTCDLGLLTFNFATTTDIARRVMNLDSAQRAVETFGPAMTKNAELWYPDDTNCSSGCSGSDTVIGIPGTGAAEVDGLLVTHELGHVVHKQTIAISTSFGADYSLSGNGWDNTSLEYEKAATVEGFADFVAMAAWFNPNSTSAIPFGWGDDYETATPQETTCSSNKGIVLQVAKAFWDWNDVHNENGVGDASGYDDEDSKSTVDIAKGWTFFAAGTANRENAESHRDGINVRDYIANTDNEWWGGDGTLDETLRRHNCLTSQTDS